MGSVDITVQTDRVRLLTLLFLDMASFTCLACRVVFKDAENQRAHYKTDWHRYNLKRKVAELPPVTFGEFNHIVQFHTEKREEKLQEKTLHCQVCGKSFNSDNAYG